MSSVALNDRGFTLGHGLFETVLAVDGYLVQWVAHMERLARACPVLGLPAPDPDACREAALAALAAAGRPHRAAVRVNWSAGIGDRGLDPPATLAPRLSATAHPVTAASTPLRLAVARTCRNDGSPASRVKALAYLDNVLARAEARAAGADEALMLNTKGEVACAAAANVFWVADGAVLTPALDCGVLDGVVRAEVLRACAALGIRLDEVRAGAAELRGAPMFVTNSLMGVRAVASLDGAALPTTGLVQTLYAATNAV